MKQTVKTMGILQIFLLYCFVMFLNSAPEITTKFPESDQHTAQYSLFSKSGVNSLLHTSGNESGLSTITSLAPTCIKFCGNQIFKALSKQEETAAICFTSYQQFSKNILLRIMQRDIIFPFHYFW